MIYFLLTEIQNTGTWKKYSISVIKCMQFMRTRNRYLCQVPVTSTSTLAYKYGLTFHSFQWLKSYVESDIF